LSLATPRRLHVSGGKARKNVSVAPRTLANSATMSGHGRRFACAAITIARCDTIRRATSTCRMRSCSADKIGRKVKDPKKSWLKCWTDAGITDLHFHDLRHEAASRLLE
jgi:hypothetical protein